MVMMLGSDAGGSDAVTDAGREVMFVIDASGTPWRGSGGTPGVRFESSKGEDSEDGAISGTGSGGRAGSVAGPMREEKRLSSHASISSCVSFSK